MPLQQEIEEFRTKHNIPVCIMCNALNLESAEEYIAFLQGKIKLSVYQKIGFVEAFNYAPPSIMKK